MTSNERPSILLGTMVVGLTTTLWAVLHLAVFRELHFPLTFVLPLLLCVWTQRTWHLIAMAVLFVGMSTVEVLAILPGAFLSEKGWVYASRLFNIVVGALAVHAIMRLRESADARLLEIARKNAAIEAQSAVLARQNADLESQATEMAQQNEEIRGQSEELAQQHEQIETQSEELERQNEELIESNRRIESRERILQTIVLCSREKGGGRIALEQICEHALLALGAPGDAIAVFEQEGKRLRLRAQRAKTGCPSFPQEWDPDGSLCGLVLREDRTAYVDDFRCRRDLALSFAGGEAHLSALAAPIPHAGSPSGVLLVCSDHAAHWTQDQFRLVEWIAAQCGLLLETLRWQREVEARAQEIETASRAKDNFLAALSHELRTPLTPVLAAVGELEHDSRLPGDVREDLAMISRNVAVQSRIIDDLLDLARITRGKLDLQQQVVAVEPLLRHTADIIAGDLSERKQTLQLELQLPFQCAVLGDGARLQQVLWNLLKNSVKFSPPGAVVRLRAFVAAAEERSGGEHPALRGDRIVIEVIDHGSGIEPRDVDRIFLPFEQVATSRRRGGDSGLGLGLSIARAITELHDGTLRARSEGAGKGAVFTVELPLASLPHQPLLTAPGGDGHRVAGPDGSAHRILLVEDHDDTGKVLARILTRCGYDVRHARSVADALSCWAECRCHLLISDLGLPDGTGLDVLRSLRASQPDLPGICMSGYGMESDVRESRAAGFTEHLIKPVNTHHLRAAVRQILEAKTSGS